MRGRCRPRGLFSVAAMGKCNWCRTTLEPGDRHQKGPRACVACLATINQFHCHCEQRWPRVVPPRLLVPADPNADAPHSIGPRLAGAFGADDEYIYIALFCSPFHLFWLLRVPRTHKKTERPANGSRRDHNLPEWIPSCLEEHAPDCGDDDCCWCGNDANSEFRMDDGRGLENLAATHVIYDVRLWRTEWVDGRRLIWNVAAILSILDLIECFNVSNSIKSMWI